MIESEINQPIIFLQLTNACNAKCAHCCVDSKFRFPEEVSEQDVYRLLDDLHEIGVRTFSVTGGEPVLRPDLAKIIRYASQRDMYVCLETNGAYLSNPKIEALLDSGLDLFSISLDGTTAATNDSFRSTPGLFEKVVNRLQYLANRGVPHAVWCTVSKMNYEEASAMPEFLLDIGVRHITFINMSPIGRGYGRDDLLLTNDEWILFYQIIEKKRKVIGQQIQMRFNPYMIDENDLSIFEDRPFDCTARQQKSVHIRADGEVFPCVLVLNQNHFSLGNIRHQRFIDIWNEPLSWKDWGTGQRSEACERCMLRPECHGGCPAYAWAYQKDSCGRDPRCDGKHYPVCPCITSWTGVGEAIGAII